MQVLCAYATRHGSTQGIAERIAARLREQGHDVSLRPAGKVATPEAFDALVIGSAAYMGGWLGDATTLVRRNQALLRARPVWLFSSGPVGSDLVDAKGRDVIEVSTPKEFGEFEASIRPRGTRVFFGAFDPDAAPVGVAEGFMSKMLRLIPEARNAMPAGDFRDWPAIDAWADEIAEALAAMSTPPAAH
jgi:menaquinone-dependent protoporphyrinogen oxidase